MRKLSLKLCLSTKKILRCLINKLPVLNRNIPGASQEYYKKFLEPKFRLFKRRGIGDLEIRGNQAAHNFQPYFWIFFECVDFFLTFVVQQHQFETY